MDRTPRSNPPAHGRKRSAIRRLLLLPLPPNGVRIIDIVILPVGAVVALLVCIPILIGSALAVVAVGALLSAVGAPEAIRGLAGIVLFGGALVLCFVVLLRLYRRLPVGIRSWITPADEDDDQGIPVLGKDPEADDATFAERIAVADATLAQGDADRPRS